MTREQMKKRRRATIKVLSYYNETAVDKAIAASNRSGRHIGKSEARAIHALLKGRH